MFFRMPYDSSRCDMQSKSRIERIIMALIARFAMFCGGFFLFWDTVQTAPDSFFGLMSRYLLAKHAQLSLASPLFVHGNSEMDQGDGIDGQAGQASSPRPIRLYLHLKNFAPGELPHRSNLSGIGEQCLDI